MMDELRGARDSGKGEASYPPDHKPGMRVPKGGSMCKNCEYLEDAEKRICSSEYFVEWNGSEVIPGPIDEYCSDYWEPAKVKPLGKKEARSMTFSEIINSERPAEMERG